MEDVIGWFVFKKEIVSRMVILFVVYFEWVEKGGSVRYRRGSRWEYENFSALVRYRFIRRTSRV